MAILREALLHGIPIVRLIEPWNATKVVQNPLELIMHGCAACLRARRRTAGASPDELPRGIGSRLRVPDNDLLAHFRKTTHARAAKETTKAPPSAALRHLRLRLRLRITSIPTAMIGPAPLAKPATTLRVSTLKAPKVA